MNLNTQQAQKHINLVQVGPESDQDKENSNNLSNVEEEKVESTIVHEFEDMLGPTKTHRKMRTDQICPIKKSFMIEL